MRPRDLARNRRQPTLERCEDRALLTLVVVFNGNSFRAAKPDALTAQAAAVLRAAGNQVVQLGNPAINSPAALTKLAGQVAKLADGRSVGLVGFSAGGALALRVATDSRVHASAVLDYYGVPDVQDFLNRHAADGFVRPIAGLAPFRPAVVNAFSGSIATTAHIVGAFGQDDPNVAAATSEADLKADAPTADVETYPGGHGAAINASPTALQDFLAHL